MVQGSLLIIILHYYLKKKLCL
uniref:Uncharacterized protein n=1 Tax=Anguilla anguilla TaxID=7936 RepID=A0A0E9T445_ANGAN